MSRGRRADERGSRGDVPRKVLISLGVGAVAYALASLFDGLSQERQVWGLTLSVFFGGITLVTQLLAEFDHRLSRVQSALEHHARAIEDRVSAGFSKINEVTELFGLVEASALQTDGVIQLVRNSTRIDPTAPPLVFRFAQAEITRMSEFLKELSDGGNVVYEGEDRDWMLALTRNIDSSIDATSLTRVDAGNGGFVDGGLWASDLGQRYLDAQRNAIQRGVRIRRVFIYDRSDNASQDALMAICRLQRDMGVDVRTLDASAVPGLRRSSLFDFILFDNVISYEVTPALMVEGLARPTILTTRLELRQPRVQDRIQRFKDLWASAREPD